IVILGGGTPARVRAGARLYRGGFAPDIYLSTDFDPRYAPSATPVGEASRRYLREAGIPGAAIVHDRRPRTTRDEARYFTEEAARRGWRSALLVTAPFHLRRATLVFRRAARERGVDIPIRAIAAGDDHEGGWWHATPQVAFALSELASLLAYRLLRRL
ncbi:MAG TPA: YdcF family protein, partial [Thermomicrobiales bacterium]